MMPDMSFTIILQESIRGTRMVDKSDFTIYKEENISLDGKIENGCLHLESAVYGDDYDSEKYYDFTKEDTDRLFSLISFEDFLKKCREGHLMWMEDFLERNNISPKTFCY